MANPNPYGNQNWAGSFGQDGQYPQATGGYQGQPQQNAGQQFQGAQWGQNQHMLQQIQQLQFQVHTLQQQLYQRDQLLLQHNIPIPTPQDPQQHYQQEPQQQPWNLYLKLLPAQAETQMNMPIRGPAPTPDLSLPPRPRQGPAAFRLPPRPMQGSAAVQEDHDPYEPPEVIPTRPPCEASGGVPEPTASYLSTASQPPIASPSPRPLLIVIDLNGTLLHRPNPKQYPRKFVKRPHADKFLKHCFEIGQVMIWSSARHRNVRDMVDSMFSNKTNRERLVDVWDRGHFGLTQEDFNDKVQCYKRLSKLWADEKIAASHPDAEPGKPSLWDQSNTVLIDDSMEKARSEPYNAVMPPKFEGLEKDGSEKGFSRSLVPVLAQVQEYLSVLSRQMDVSSYMKVRRFEVDREWQKMT